MNFQDDTLEMAQCHDCKYVQREYILLKKRIAVVDSCTLGEDKKINIDKDICTFYQKSTISLRDVPRG